MNQQNQDINLQERPIKRIEDTSRPAEQILAEEKEELQKMDKRPSLFHSSIVPTEFDFHPP